MTYNIPQENFRTHDSAVGEVYLVNIAFIAVTVVIVGVRLVVRGLVARYVGADDYLMLAAGFFSVAFSAMNIFGTLFPFLSIYLQRLTTTATRYGLGKHIWDLPQTPELKDTIKKVVQILWICQVMYATALMFVKISIVTSYLRAFPIRTFRWIMYILSAAIIAVWICSIFVTIFQCSPVSGAWDFTRTRKCLPVFTFFYFTTAFSIFTDFLLCILPLPVFWKLKLPRRQRNIVSLLFGVGLLATVASALRISVLRNIDSLDATMGSVTTIRWSVVEVAIGIICACIPRLKPLFKHLFPDRNSASKFQLSTDTTWSHTPKMYYGDKFGRTPFSWAARKGRSNVKNLILEKYDTNGMVIRDQVVYVGSAPADNQESCVYCDICISWIPNAKIHYHCGVCIDGGFNICQDCGANGAYCLDDSHNLVRRMMKNRKFLDVSN